MFVGTLVVDLLLGDVHSVKEKRGIVRPVIAELKRLEVAVAETGHLDLHRRAEIAVAVVAADSAHCRRVLETAERTVSGHPEFDILSARVRVRADSDDD